MKLALSNKTKQSLKSLEIKILTSTSITAIIADSEYYMKLTHNTVFKMISTSNVLKGKQRNYRSSIYFILSHRLHGVVLPYIIDCLYILTLNFKL